jgi:hypothetical protein
LELQARDYLHRKLYGLSTKNRGGKYTFDDIYKTDKDGNLMFNAGGKVDKKFSKEMMDEPLKRLNAQLKYSSLNIGGHPILGSTGMETVGLARIAKNPVSKEKLIALNKELKDIGYYDTPFPLHDRGFDIWDFGLNPGETAPTLLDIIRNKGKLSNLATKGRQLVTKHLDLTPSKVVSDRLKPSEAQHLGRKRFAEEISEKYQELKRKQNPLPVFGKPTKK